METRKHGTYRIIDTERRTIAFGGDYICDGSHRPFRIEWFPRTPNGTGNRRGITVPALSFRRAYALKRIGGLAVWQLQSRILRRIALNPNR